MMSYSGRLTSYGGFGILHGSEEEEFCSSDNGIESNANIDNDYCITESGRTAAHVIANLKENSDAIDDFTESSDRPDEFLSDKIGINTRSRSNSSAVPVSISSMTSDQGEGIYENSSSDFLSEMVNSNQGALSRTPPAASSFESRHFGKRPRVGVRGRIIWKFSDSSLILFHVI
jgi:hypothetical protein